MTTRAAQHRSETAEPTAGADLLRIAPGLIPETLVAEAVETFTDMIRTGLPTRERTAGDIDALVDRLRTHDRVRLGAIYDAFRETIIFQRIVTCPELLSAAADMIGAERLHTPFQHCVFRMDLAGEHWRGFGWHQDYPYNMLSGTSVTAWTPLTPASAANGSVEVAPTLSNQIYPVEIRFKRDALGQRLGTRDAFIADRLQDGFLTGAETLTLAPGDVALFSNRLVHRSGFNPGPRHRYSIQARYGDLMASEMTQRGWRNRRADGFDTFKALHPDLVEYEETP